MKITPMLEQYKKIKENHKDSILFYRVGDFYETFFDDAVVASRELDIVLTSRNSTSENNYPLAGVPYHAAEQYINRLVEKGYKVAICEQVQDPKEASGIVERDVVKIVTPGTTINDDILNKSSFNYLGSFYKYENGFIIALTDISIGEFDIYLNDSSNAKNSIDELLSELYNSPPTELLVDKSLIDEKENVLLNEFLLENNIYRTDIEFPDVENAKYLMKKYFTGNYFSDLVDTDNLNNIEIVTSAILEYIHHTQKTSFNHIKKLKIKRNHDYMLLDKATFNNLEIKKSSRDNNDRATSLYSTINYTTTSMGARYLSKCLEKPLISKDEINRRLDCVQEIYDSYNLQSELKKLLSSINDLERLAGKLSFNVAGPRDILALAKSLHIIPEVVYILQRYNKKNLVMMTSSMVDLDSLEQLVTNAIIDNPSIGISDGGIIKEGYSKQLDEMRYQCFDGKQWMANYENLEKERTGIKSLKVSFNRVFGYYIELTKANLSMVPDNYVRKQTLANAERFITPELKKYEDMILGAEDKIKNLEYELFVDIREKCRQRVTDILTNAEIISSLDVYLSHAICAVNNKYTRPQVNESSKIRIVEGRHPVVEKFKKDISFIPNNTFLDHEKQRVLLITGPNMAGKSTYIRQVALIVLLAQIGCYVPALEAEIGIVDRLLARIGASDNLSAGKSTFMVEMSEMSYIIANATSKSLILLDEIGRGTSTYDGLSIAQSIIEYIYDLKKIGAKTLFATHYHELTSLASYLPGIVNFSTEINEDGENIVFLHKIVKGKADRSYGIHVAKLAGLPDNIVLRAQELLKTYEKRKVNSKEKIAVDHNTSYTQLSFTQESTAEKLLVEIRQLDLLTITPLEALNKINTWQKKIATDTTTE